MLAPLLSASVAAAVLALDRETGLPALMELEERIAGSRSRLRALRVEHEALGAGIRGLRAGGFAIEMRARETLGMVRSGERVLVWEPTPRAPRRHSD